MKSIFKKILGPFAWQNLKDLKSNILPLSKDRIKLVEASVKTLEKANFYAQFLPEKSLCFDIGSHLGDKAHSMILAQSKVVAVEPQKKLVKKLLKRFKNEINIINKGISNQVGKEDFFISDANTLSTFSKDWTEKMKASRFKIYHWKKNKNQIETTTIDELIKNYGKPCFIKLDVEGYELKALNGLSQSIPIICFEFAIPEFKENLYSCLKRLNELNANYLFNYVVGEKNEFELTNNLNYKLFLEHVSSPLFDKIGFGDIYAFEK